MRTRGTILSALLLGVMTAGYLLLPAFAERERPKDARAGYYFVLDVPGRMQGFFTEVSGIGSENEVLEHKVVDETGREMVVKIPGRLRFPDMTLRRGITSNLDFWTWRKMVEDGDYEGARVNGSITMYDPYQMPVAQWNFENAWPKKITGPQPKSDSEPLGLEELVLVYEYMERVK